MPKVPKKKETYLIKCKICGYVTESFHGWVFATGNCYTPNEPNMLHDWGVPLDDILLRERDFNAED